MNYYHSSGINPSETGRRPKRNLRQSERLSDAPPADTQIPDIAKHEATLDELLSYYPNHCLTWPGLAMVSTLTSYTHASDVINKARGSLENSEKNQHAPRTNVRYYTRLASIDHLKVNDIPDYSEESLRRHLESFLWDAPSKISSVLQPSWSLRSIGQGIENHPNGSFANRVKASLVGFDLPQNQLYSQSPTHRIIDFAIARRGNRDNVRDILGEIRDKSNRQNDNYSAPAPIFDKNGEPLNMERLEFVRKHHQLLKQQALLWVFREMNSRQVARELKKARPDVVKNEEQYAAMLRKRKEKILQREPLQKGMHRSVYSQTTGKQQRGLLSDQDNEKNKQDCRESPSSVIYPLSTCDVPGASIGTDTDMDFLGPSTTDLASSCEVVAGEANTFHLGIGSSIPDQAVLDQPFLGQPIPENANELRPGQAIDISNIHGNMLARTTIVRLPDMLRPGAILHDTPMVESYEGHRSTEEIMETIMNDD